MSEDLDLETVRYEVVDHVATVTLARPHMSNAFTPQMRDELLRVLDRTDGDDDVRAVIFTGAGRAFCAGADLSSGGFVAGTIETSTTDPHLTRDGGGRVSLRIYESLKTIIGAINGAAVGFGATVTLPMDVRIASTFAKYGFVFAKRGIVPDGAASWFLPRIVGISRATEWSFTGRLISGDELLGSGLVSAVLAPDELLPAARRLAQQMIEGSAPVSVALTRQLFWKMLGATDPMDAHIAESRALYSRMRAPDAREGVASFLEKRAATFSGRASADLPAIFQHLPAPVFPDEPVSPEYALHLKQP